jgi:pimeloyl-ACP methyl ester carboxylesterase
MRGLLDDSSLRLRDGRSLGYAEWGRRDGEPVIYFHGLPGSRFECWAGGAAYTAVGAHLITIDRPGIGRSDPKPDRKLSEWPDDVAELTEALGCERFSVMGHSAGTVYALACANRLPDRIDAVVAIGAVPRLDHPDVLGGIATARYWHMAREHPGRMRANYRALAALLRLAPRLGQRLLLRHASDADRAALAGPDAHRRLKGSVLEAVRRGPAGLVEDMRVLMRPWQLQLTEIAPPVHLWHGGDDAYVNPSTANRYAEELPRANLVVIPGEGHFSLPERRAAQIVAGVIADEGGN